MEAKLLTLTIVLQIITIQCVQFIIQNNVPGPIWIGTQGSDGHAALENGGFVLNQGEERTVTTDDTQWNGRFWARTWCTPDTQNCQTGDCGNKLECNGAGGVPPVTLAEFKLRGDGNQDFYDVSVVDGFNVLTSIAPINGQGDCRTVSCNFNLNSECPQDLQQIGGNRNDVIACYSSCEKYQTDQYCCRGDYNDPNKCKPNNMPQPNSIEYFESHCPQYYSYAYDDPSSLLTCLSSTYKITFT